tara:strand:- start:48147 stop:48437 length:291 start_codon:yes stop_codon:yes gene_type:complete
MLYEYYNKETEEIIERNYPMGEYPDKIKVDGKPFVRIMSTPQISAGVKGIVHGYPYEAKSLPDNLPGCEHTKKGVPIIQSRQHEREIAAREDCHRD